MRIREAKDFQFHDAPILMTVPMLFLATCSLFVIHSWNPLSYATAHLIQGLQVTYPFAAIESLHMVIPVLLTTTAIISWVVAYQWYVKEKYPLQEDNKLIHSSRQQFGINKILDTGLANLVVQLGIISHWIDKNIVDGFVNAAGTFTRTLSRVSTWIDMHIVDGIVNAIAQLTYMIGHILRHVQNGRLQNYLSFVFTLILIGIIYLIIR